MPEDQERLVKSPIPLYYQLKQIMIEKIKTREWEPDSLVPSERELTELYRVSRATVRQAISELVNAGMLYRKQGKGTFVAHPKLEQSLRSIYSFTHSMRALGLEPSSRVLVQAVVDPPQEVRQMLNLKVGEKVIKLERIRLANGEPLLVENTCVPEKLAPGLNTVDLAGGSLYDFLTHKYHHTISSARESLEPVIIDNYTADLLRVQPHKPAFAVERVAFTAESQPVEHTKSIARGDRLRYIVELTGTLVQFSRLVDGSSLDQVETRGG